MRLSPPHTGVAGPARPSASSVLGASHPLVRTIEALSAVARQSLAVAALLAASLVAAGADAGWARPIAASAVVVLVAPPLFDPRVVTAVADELRDVAALLCSERSDARASALVWRLICDGVESPLHRGEVEELREELGRIRFLLSTGSVPRRGTATGSAGDARDEADHR